MSEEILASVQVRRDSKANWEAANPVLLDGEAAYEKDTDMFKIGDGVKRYRDLPYHNKVGPQGPQGEPGPTPQISMNVSTGNPGTSASVSVTGTAENPVINLTVPRGDTGKTGSTGPKGDTGSSGVYIGTSQPTDSNINVWIDPDGEASFKVVRSVNGKTPDDSGAVTLTMVEIDDTLTQSGKAADAKAVGDRLSALNEANAELKDDFTTLNEAISDGFIDANDIKWEFATAVNSSGLYIDNSKEFYNGRYTTPDLMTFKAQRIYVSTGATFRFYVYEYLPDGTYNKYYTVGKNTGTEGINGSIVLNDGYQYRFSYIPPNNTITVDMSTLSFRISKSNYMESIMIKSDDISFDSTEKAYTNCIDISEVLQRYVDSNNIVVIPSGKYFIGNTITIKRPIKVVGYGAEIYCNPEELGYKKVFDVLSSNVSIEGISFRSESVYNAFFAPDKFDVGLSSNVVCLFTTEVDNVSIKNCNAYCCYSLLRNAVNNYDWNTFSKGITVDSCYCDYSACGVSGAGFKDLKITNTTIRNINMGNLCHCVYISRYSDGIFIDNCRFFATTNIEANEGVTPQEDIITFHPSHQLYNFYSIKNVKVSNCVFDGDDAITYGIDIGSVEKATFSNNSFNGIKNSARFIYHCENVLFDSCNFTLNNTSGIFFFSQVSGADSSYIWSYKEIRCVNCVFDLYYPGTYIIRHWHNMDFVGCYFNIKSRTNNDVDSIFISPIDASDNDIYRKRMLRLINCSVMYDTYSTVNLYNSANTKAFNDIVVLDGLSVKKITGVGQTAVILGNNDTVHCMGCTFVGWKNITNNTDKFVDYGNNVCCDIISKT